jgi:hypothetical protein
MTSPPILYYFVPRFSDMYVLTIALLSIPASILALSFDPRDLNRHCYSTFCYCYCVSSPLRGRPSMQPRYKHITHCIYMYFLCVLLVGLYGYRWCTAYPRRDHTQAVSDQSNMSIYCLYVMCQCHRDIFW